MTSAAWRSLSVVRTSLHSNPARSKSSDFGAAGLYRLAGEGRLDAVQAVVAVTTLTLFIPCVANFLVIVKERGWRTGLAVAAFVFPFALCVGAALNALLRSAPWILG